MVDIETQNNDLVSGTDIVVSYSSVCHSQRGDTIDDDRGSHEDFWVPLTLPLRRRPIGRGVVRELSTLSLHP